MSFWKSLFGGSRKAENFEKDQSKNQIIEEPPHDLSKAPPDDLMIVNNKKEQDNIGTNTIVKEDEDIDSNINDQTNNLNNKDSP